ncbi:WecB/TagA/CpsF family glycosyltransferase [Sulfitobacter sp. D35]|uniref:sugar transferase n=1 Tax=Sulfitobacter sp. D35 TaxID=3083252 RepID=UPI00296FFC27|nr:WecB/TagA/CpsF family glycosyltransferase [Sulfitobacter sp. D35]MDW4498530.1 WecB/TagA/CpsF family glycosyltransferase [Sulfitobacter sp. D35]
MSYISAAELFRTPVPNADPVGRVKARSAAIRSVRLFGLDIVSASTGTVIRQLLAPGGRNRVAFLNAHCANVMHRDAEYADAMQTAGMVLPDGIGVDLAARMTGAELEENLNGTDFVPALLAEAAHRGLAVFLLGGRPGVAEAAARKLCLSTPGLRIAGTRDGYEGAADTADAIRAINASKADIVLVAMGVPAQDIWLARHADKIEARVTMGVGALFDFLADRVRRAPASVRRARCEWIWRLAMEPRRMAGRYLVGNVSFMVRAARHAFGQREEGAIAKRALDLALVLPALMILVPLVALIAVCIKLDSRGPVLYSQIRVGRYGRHFTMYKFRSMHVDAEARRAELLESSDREGVCFKSRNDPRITRIGRILRRCSIDELPQLLNVLRGEMSLVGPRPALPEEVAAYPGRALGRLACKPGLTGIWQVSGRAEIGFDKMIDMDLAYAAARSTPLDLLLVLMTFRAVLTGRGAY